MADIFKIINNINVETKNILASKEVSVSDYLPFMVNKALSYHNDTILYANEMNINNSLAKDIQYNYLFNSIKKRKRFYKWYKADEDNEIDLIVKEYKVNNQKAIQIKKLLTEEQMNILKKKYNTGGVSK